MVRVRVGVWYEIVKSRRGIGDPTCAVMHCCDEHPIKLRISLSQPVEFTFPYTTTM